MDVRRLIAIIVVVTLLAVGAVGPPPAHANTGDDFIYAGIGVAAYVGLVVLGTAIVYRTPSESTFTPADIPVRRDRSEPAVRLGQQCRQTGPTIKLLCW
jgi:hypothetical protein